MSLLAFLSFSLLFCSCNSRQQAQWNSEQIEKTVYPMVRKFATSWSSHVIENREYHYKTHFGIVIKKGTKFTLSIETPNVVDSLYFFCPTEETKEFPVINLSYETNCTKILTTNFDCVPMTSVSYNTPVKVKIITKNWMSLPVFYSKNVTLLTSHSAETEFYQNIQTYGFVENDYTQMLLSTNDIKGIKSKGYSLYIALQNQVDVIKYYNYLTGASRYADETDSYSYALVEKYRLFLRTEKCDKDCNYGAYFCSFWIVCPDGIVEFLKPDRGSQWALLHEIAHYYDIKGSVPGFGNTIEVWTNIFSAFYQHKFHVDTYWMKETEFDDLSTLSKYQKGIPFEKWDYKEQLHFFMSIFGYDGTDRSFREFNTRYFFSKSGGIPDNIIPTILEVFLDLYDVNLLPYLRKVIDFENSTIPLLNPDLELRLLGGRAVMPVVDFGINPTDLQSGSRERDLREYSPLMLMTKMRKKYVQVEFIFESPVDLTNYCLYLNNKCYAISSNGMKLQLLVDTYSIYIAEKINNALIISDIDYRVISQKTKITVKVKKIGDDEIFLPGLYYFFDALGYNDVIFLQIFINYKDMTISIVQMTDQIHAFFPEELYFSVSLKRNGVNVFEYNFFGSSQTEQEFVNVAYKLEVYDEIHIYHREPSRLKINLAGCNIETVDNTFVITNLGLRNATDEMDFQFVYSDIQRIDEFNTNYNIDLSYNSFYQVFLAHYANLLIAIGFSDYVPKNWILS